jgi:NAD(P)-dependent dehydrogenase (short-subunit alcohol dehydrogenase family)
MRKKITGEQFINDQLLSLEGKVAIITGGASGIGLGTAGKLAAFGAAVSILDINDTDGMSAENEIIKAGGKAHYIHCDVRIPGECKKAVDETFHLFGRIDILFNNAGIAVRKNAIDLEPEEWDLSLDVSLKGQYLITKYAVPYMIKTGGGSIINTGSGWSLKGGENALSYCAMKGGTLNMTRAMAIDFGKYNIRVNTVCPGDIDTPMLKSECEQLGVAYNDEYIRSCCSERPIKRIGTADDVANVVLFFAGNMSTWITGAHLVVDGGGIA